MYHFCTYFDHRYLSRGLALHASLVRHVGTFQLHVLCLDERSFEELRQRQLPEVVPHRLAEMEAWEPRLERVRQERSPVEYFFTCSPCLPLYVLDRQPAAEHVIYLDADLYFFANPAALLDRLQSASVLLLGHRFPPHLLHLQKFGLYNVGLVGFRNDATGRACLDWWRERCLEWCFDRREGARFADQRYLDEWPERFPNVAVAPDKGANLAPWNVGGHVLRAKGGQVFVDGEPLLFYHFHGVRPRSRQVFDLGLNEYHAFLGSVLQQHVYGPYLRELRSFLSRDDSPGISPRTSLAWSHSGPRLLVTDGLVTELRPEGRGERKRGDPLSWRGADTDAEDRSAVLALAALARQRQEVLEEHEATIRTLRGDVCQKEEGLRQKDKALAVLPRLNATIAEKEEVIGRLLVELRQKDEAIALSTALREDERKEHLRIITELAAVAEHRKVLLHLREETVAQLQASQALANGGRHALRVLVRTSWRRVSHLLPL